jgi:nitrate/TMAO reductase-like tetraheme cytochrome c subunit
MIPAILILSAVVIIVLAWRARHAGRGRGGGARRSYAVLALGVLPVLWVVGTLAYADRATRMTSFCLQCHEMAPYGASVTAGGPSVPARHFENEWVERETACYVCHTSPGISGYALAKAKGLRDVFVHFVGTVPDEIRLDAPYDTAICLSCHGRDEAFLELASHQQIIDTAPGGEVTCAGCHAFAHDLTD